MRWVLVAAGLAAGVSSAQAQSLTFAPYSGSSAPDIFQGIPVNLATDYLQLTRCPNGPGNGACTGAGFVSLGQVYGAIPSQPVVDPGANQALSASLVALAGRLDRFTDRFREGIALAGSINVLPPNPGDRFAVSLGGAGYDGTGAGSIAVSARLREDIIAYGAVARGPSQTLVKGGVGMSFR